MSVWGDIAGGAAGVYGYNELMDNLSQSQQGVNQQLETLQQGVQDMTGFQPWGVTSNMGNVGVDQGGLNFNLNPQQQAYADQMGQGASSLFNQATQDPQARQQQLFDQMQTARAPALQQAYGNLQENIWGQGTGGMQTTTFGGNPEQYAFGKALADSQGADMINARGLAQGEQMQQANIGQQMFGNQFMPQQQLAGLMGYGINNQQLNNDMTREQASLWSQLGLGGLTANTNFENIRAGAFGDMVGAATPFAQAAGDYLGENAGSIWDTISGYF